MSENTQENELTFSEEQQTFVDKLVGKARVKARELAKEEFEAAAKEASTEAERKELAASAEFEKLATMHADRVKELEPFEVEAMAYRAMVADMLKDRIKELGDKAKVAIKALPPSMSDLERLNWLNKNQELFATEGTSRVGTPASKQKKLQKEQDVAGRRRVHL